MRVRNKLEKNKLGISKLGKNKLGRKKLVRASNAEQLYTTVLNLVDAKSCVEKKLLQQKSMNELIDNNLNDKNTTTMETDSCMNSKDNEIEEITKRLDDASLRYDSDDDDFENQACINPFKTTDKNRGAEQQSTDDSEDELSADCRMASFEHCIQSRCAIPEYALSDAVFSVDRPKDAVRLGYELPKMELSKNYVSGAVFKLQVCEVYTPFQFWFNAIDGIYSLEYMKRNYYQYSQFYDGCTPRWKLTPFFVKPGYLCTARYGLEWKRAQIVKSVLDNDEITIYMIDSGRGAVVSIKELYFLKQSFAEHPALAMRGTLTDVQPLGLHWPPSAIIHFKYLVNAYELYAQIKDIDKADRILFINLSEKRCFKSTISTQMINDKFAAESSHYDAKVQASYGHRARYLRELLPSFEMLETQVFPRTLPDFEDTFDHIIYKPSFHNYYRPPNITNPFLSDLDYALTKWLEVYKINQTNLYKQKQELGKIK